MSPLRRVRLLGCLLCLCVIGGLVTVPVPEAAADHSSTHPAFKTNLLKHDSPSEPAFLVASGFDLHYASQNFVGSLANEFGPASGRFDEDDYHHFPDGGRYPNRVLPSATMGDVGHVVGGSGSLDLILASPSLVQMYRNMDQGFTRDVRDSLAAPFGTSIAGVSGRANKVELWLNGFKGATGPHLWELEVDERGFCENHSTCSQPFAKPIAFNGAARILAVRDRDTWERGPFDQPGRIPLTVLAVEEKRDDGTYVKFHAPNVGSAGIKIADEGSVQRVSLDFDRSPNAPDGSVVGLAYARALVGGNFTGIPLAFKLGAGGSSVRRLSAQENVCGEGDKTSVVFDVTELPAVPDGDGAHEHHGLAQLLAACQAPAKGIHLFGDAHGSAFNHNLSDIAYLGRLVEPGDGDVPAALAIDYACLRLHEIEERKRKQCQSTLYSEDTEGPSSFEYHHETFGNAVLKTFAADGTGLRYSVHPATQNGGANGDRSKALERKMTTTRFKDWNGLIPGSEDTKKSEDDPPLVFRLPRDRTKLNVRLKDTKQRELMVGVPMPVAVLAAPPYVAGAGQEAHSGPSFFQSRTSSTSESKSTTGHWRVGIVGGYDGNIPAVGGVEAELEAVYEGSVTNGDTLSRGFTITDGVIGAPAEDTIVYEAAQFWLFDGTVESSSLGYPNEKPHIITQPRGSVTTSESVESFKARFPEYGPGGEYGASLDAVLSHTLGDPATYMSWGEGDRSKEVSDYCVGDFDANSGGGDFDDGPNIPENSYFDPARPDPGPAILYGNEHFVQRGTSGAEVSSIEIFEGHEKTRVETAGFDIGLTVKKKLAGGRLGITAGGGMTFTREWTSSLETGTQFEGQVGHIPDDKAFAGSEHYNWRAFLCQRYLSSSSTNLSAGSVFVLNYTVDGYGGTRGVPSLESITPVSPNGTILESKPTFKWNPSGIAQKYVIDVEPVGSAAESTSSSVGYTTAEKAKADHVGCADKPLADIASSSYGELSLSPPVDRFDDGFATTASSASCTRTPSGRRNTHYDSELDPGKLYRWRVRGTDFAGGEVTSEWTYFRTASSPAGSIDVSVPRAEGDDRPPVPIAGDTVTFKVRVEDDGGGPVTASWDLGDDRSHTDKSAQRQYPVPGDYPISVTLTNSFGLSTTLHEIVSVQDPSPLAEFTYAPSDPTTAAPVSFSGSSIDDLAPADASRTYTWDFGDGNVGTGKNVTHRYSEPGTHPVTLTVTSFRGDPANDATPRFVGTATGFVRVGDGSPAAGFTFSPSQPSTTDTVGFQDASTDHNAGDLVASWDFGDGTTATGPAVDHRYTEPGVYEVKMSVQNGTTGLTDQIRRTIGVSDFTPSPDFVTSDEASTAAAVAFRYVPDASQPAPDSRTFSWDFGDGTTSTEQDPAHRYTEAGSYSVRLDVTEVHGGISYTGSVIRSVFVADGSPKAEFDFAPPRPSTADTITFEDLSTDPTPGATLNATWDFGDGITATGSAPEHRYTEPGAYEVTLRVVNPGSGLAGEIKRTVSVSDGTPSASFRWSPTEVSTADTVDISATATDPGDRPLNHRWQIDDETPRTGADALSAFRFSEPGTHEIKLTVTNDAGLSNEIVRTVYVTDGSPAADIWTAGGFNSTPTEFRDLSADPGGRPLTYRWDWGDGSPDLVWGLGQRPADGIARHLYAHPGTYTVTLTLTNDAGLKTSQEFFVRIEDGTPRAEFLVSPEAPTTSLTTKLRDRSSDPADLELSYNWDFGDGTTSTAEFPVHSYRTAGVYDLRLTVTNPAGMSDTVGKKIRVEPGNPIADFTWSPKQPLTLDEVTFTSDSRDPAGLPLAFEWDFGDGTPIATGAEVTHEFARAGSYPVTLKATNTAGEIDTVVLTVPVRNRPAQPKFSWAPDQPWLLEPVRFSDESIDLDGEVVAWHWDFGDGTSSTERHPEHAYEWCGAYRVTLTVWDDVGAVSSFTDDVRYYIAPDLPRPREVCTYPPPARPSHGRPWVQSEPELFYLSGPTGGTVEITGRADGGDAPLRNIVVRLGEDSTAKVKSVRPEDAAGRWRAHFDDFLLPGVYPVEVTAFDEQDRASDPVRYTILVV